MNTRQGWGEHMKVDGFIPQQIFHILPKEALESLKAGDLIQGKVAALENGLLLVKLLDGSGFSASVPEGFHATPGASLTLEIQERTGDRITAKIINADNQPEPGSEPQGLEAQINRKLQAMGNKSTNDMITRVLALLDENPDMGVEAATFLTANRMDSDQAMREMAIKLAEREFQLDRNLEALGQWLSDSLSRMEGSKLEKLLKPLLNQLEAEKAAGDLAGKIAALHNQVQHEGTNLKGEALTLLTRKLENLLRGLAAENKPLDSRIAFDALKTAVSSIDRNHFLNFLKISDEMLNDFTKAVEKIRMNTRAFFEQDSMEISKIIGKLFEKAYVRAEDGQTEPIDLGEKMEALKHIIDFTGESVKLIGERGGQAIQSAVLELSNALQFFSQVNTYHVFVQIPLMINNQHTTGELYVMKRKSRRGRVNPNQFTLFISLYTQNLGLVETFLNATNRCVTIHFRVENEDLSKFIKAHHKVLYDALDQKGYKLADMKLRVFAHEPVNLLNAAEVSESILGMNTRVDLKI